MPASFDAFWVNNPRWSPKSQGADCRRVRVGARNHGINLIELPTQTAYMLCHWTSPEHFKYFENAYSAAVDSLAVDNCTVSEGYAYDMAGIVVSVLVPIPCLPHQTKARPAFGLVSGWFNLVVQCRHLRLTPCRFSSY